MKRSARVGLTLLAGIAIGGGIVHGLHAQAEKKPAYVIAELQITDPDAFRTYAAKVPATLTAYHGRYIVRGKAEAKEGDAPQGTLVILAFDSLADAEQWYGTPPYHDMIPERQKAAKGNVFIVEGLPQ
ncbi:MAG TPA: DUF1330 domain-containing protein [Acidisphaera sp.]|nr:DUF1330 domain-containing protein [Acidisphaera sp.]